MADYNTTVRRWNNGGTLKIASDAILNIESGTLTWTQAKRARIEYSDRGIQKLPLEGDDELADIEFTVNCGLLQGATSIYAALCAAGASGVVATLASLIADFPTYRGATVGDRVTWTTSGANYLWVPEMPKFQVGGSPDGLDKLTCKVRANFAPTIAAYS